jgi:Dyp-type peroxidase family
MAFHREHLSDPPLEEWETGYANSKGSVQACQIIDGMILLANDDVASLDKCHREILNALAQRAEVLVTEKGRAYFNKDKSQNLEHFGYVDGRSQPVFYSTDYHLEQQKDGTDEWDPREPLSLVLVKDRLASQDAESQYFGSYFVFRKLEQNVKGFKLKEQELAKYLGLEGERQELAGAMAVGRFEDGTPVVLRPFDGLDDPVPNNFRFDLQDPNGLKCPFHAHIRKVNPRGDTILNGGLDAEERSHRIARRGITYGERNPEPKDATLDDELPERDVGLLFMCFQSSIDNQFAYMQRRFASDPQFCRRDTGLDPVIGQSRGAESASQKWPANWGDIYTKRFSFPSFVKMKGGDFFFAPSIQFLQHL